MYNFNAAQQTENLIKWIKDWFDKNGKDCNAVLGISGGKDSTIAAALCVKALGSDRVIGVMLPDGEQSDINDSVEVCRLLGIRNYTINIRSALEASFKQLQDCGIEITEQLIRMKEAEARLKHGWVTVQGSDTVVTKDADSDK